VLVGGDALSCWAAAVGCLPLGLAGFIVRASFRAATFFHAAMVITANALNPNRCRLANAKI
jgi:hypothetical protein